MLVSGSFGRSGVGDGFTAAGVFVVAGVVVADGEDSCCGAEEAVCPSRARAGEGFGGGSGVEDPVPLGASDEGGESDPAMAGGIES